MRNGINLMAEFEETAKSAISREGICEMLEWLRESDFYTAPASTRYHGAFEGGLVRHSLAVYRRLLDLVNSPYMEGVQIDQESIAICGLFHDVCKVGCYKPDTRNVKDENGVWHKVPCYKFEEEYPFGGHGAKSVYLVQHFMDLRHDEAAAINCHMGAYDSTTYSNPSNAFSTYPLAWALHVADEAATFLDKE